MNEQVRDFLLACLYSIVIPALIVVSLFGGFQIAYFVLGWGTQ